MTKSGLADSPFFSVPPKSEPVSPVGVNQEQRPTKPIKKAIKPQYNQASQPASNRDTTVSSNHDTMTPRYHDTIIDIVRKAVRELGKEAATHRFTQEEKRSIADIIYTYKNTGIKTSENEIARIAVNFIIQDYKENGENSVLEKALKALHT